MTFLDGEGYENNPSPSRSGEHASEKTPVLNNSWPNNSEQRPDTGRQLGYNYGKDP